MNLFTFKNVIIFATVLRQLSQEREPPVELDAYVKKLMNSKRRIGVVNNIVQNAQVM